MKGTTIIEKCLYYNLFIQKKKSYIGNVLYKHIYIEKELIQINSFKRIKLKIHIYIVYHMIVYIPHGI